MEFDPAILRDEHRNLLAMYVGEERVFYPDRVISPQGKPYLYRWYVVPRNKYGNVYLHVQVASDYDRALHDHPWANMSVILAGGYDEVVGDVAGNFLVKADRRPGAVVARWATDSHRLIMPEWNKLGYTMTLFTTGPKTREWGFWIDGEWVHWEKVTQETDEGSVFVNGESK